MLRHTGGKGEQPPCPPSSRAGERAAHLLGCLTWPFAGVDLVLNSLAEEKLQASVRCLAQHGRFLEIGKFDLSNNHPLGEACSPGWAVGGGLWVVGSGRGGGHELRVPPGMAIFLKNVTFHGILLDALWGRGRQLAGGGRAAAGRHPRWRGAAAQAHRVRQG